MPVFDGRARDRTVCVHGEGKIERTRNIASRIMLCVGSVAAKWNQCWEIMNVGNMVTVVRHPF